MFGFFKNKPKKVSDLRVAFESVQHRASEVMNTLELHAFSNGLRDYPAKKGVDFQKAASLKSGAWLKLARELSAAAQKVEMEAESLDEMQSQAQAALAVALEYLSLRADANADDTPEAKALQADMDIFEGETANIAKMLGTEPLSRES